jgi:hypothetical protein
MKMCPNDDIKTKLRTGLYHRTSLKHYEGIRRAGVIIPNAGQFEVTYEQSKGSYGFRNGYISLFDFESVRLNIYNEFFQEWVGFFGYLVPATLILKINRKQLKDKLIPNGSAQLGVDFFIPYAEVWYPEPIRLTSVQTYIIKFEDGSNWQLYDSSEKDEFDGTVALICQIDDRIVSRCPELLKIENHQKRSRLLKKAYDAIAISKVLTR